MHTGVHEIIITSVADGTYQNHTMHWMASVVQPRNHTRSSRGGYLMAFWETGCDVAMLTTRTLRGSVHMLEQACMFCNLRKTS